MAPNKLGKNTVRILEEYPNVYFSPISIIEIEIKSLRGKLPVLKSIFEDLTNQEFLEKPYLSKHAVEVRTFPSLVDHDPYDRMLMAQASAENLTLITADKKLLALNLSWIFDAAD